MMIYITKKVPLDTKSQVDGIKRSTGQFVESEVDQVSLHSHWTGHTGHEENLQATISLWGDV